MSELQLGLLGLGVLVVLAVIVFNKWQESRYRRTARDFESRHDDVLLGGTRHGQAAAAAPPVPDEPDIERIEPRWDDTAAPRVEATPSLAGAAPAETAAPPAALDPRVDRIADLFFDAPVPGDRLGGAVAGFGLTRRVGADGFDAGRGFWLPLAPDAVYERARVGLQLSDRGGPASGADLAAFRECVEALAQNLGATITWDQEDAEALARGAALDGFCADVDLQIGLSLIASAPFAETKLRGLAEANGFRREDDGVFRRRDDDGREVLSLRHDAANTAGLLLEVARVPRDAAAFGLMGHCARVFAKSLDARIVDDRRQPLDDAAVTGIGQGIAALHGRLEAADIPAGGRLALRLFA
ncbi:MAG: cell division protein ZipA C-terminal FtsZ-binding domain-containing protein [Burkholderiales bacterium]